MDETLPPALFPAAVATVEADAPPVKEKKPRRRKFVDPVADDAAQQTSETAPAPAVVPVKAKKEKAKAKKKPEGYTLKQRIAFFVGGVACFVLLLSVWHCTEALAHLTGSPIFLAALLAIGIDFGMVACEVASIAGDGKAKDWADRYIVLAVVLSSGLNAFASAQHTDKLVWLAAIVGGVIPVLVFILAKVAGHLYKD